VPSGIAPALPPPGTALVPSAEPSAAVLAPPPEPSCAEDMVKVSPKAARPFCVDRYEAMMVDARTGAVLSPYYPPEPGKARFLEELWRKKIGSGTELEKATRLPELPAWQRQKGLEPKAVSKRGRVPQGYVSGKDAEAACKNAGKRLCSRDEWKTACRGEQDRQFPYGDKYEQGWCNVFREAHPGVLLWEDPTINHTDPRFNLVKSEKGPLLRHTGATDRCASKWGDDAIYDMVGNLDEWIEDPEGTFVGGFYARGKKDGCDSAVESHVLSYADYSTGARCCADLP
jgi:sulfatase modifying factor 1